MPRVRIPTEQKKARGTYRADRANPKEPKYAPGEPPMPDSLSEGARQVWAEVVPLLLAQKLLAPVDGGILECYCEGVAEVRACTVVLRGTPQFYANGGLWKEHPAAKARREAMVRVERSSQQLGLTPAARSKVAPVPEPDDDDELAKLMRESEARTN